MCFASGFALLLASLPLVFVSPTRHSTAFLLHFCPHTAWAGSFSHTRPTQTHPACLSWPATHWLWQIASLARGSPLQQPAPHGTIHPLLPVGTLQSPPLQSALAASPPFLSPTGQFHL